MFLEACGEENRKCHRQAKCVVKDGVEFCNCDIGFQGDGFSCQGKGMVRRTPLRSFPVCDDTTYLYHSHVYLDLY